MLKVLYTKFSNERSKDFSIRTQILSDSEGKKYVRKQAIGRNAQKHIDKMAEWEKALNQKYSNSVFSVNKRVRVEDEFLFEFIKGNTFEDVLNKALQDGNAEFALNMLQKYVENIRTVNQQIPFESTEAFRQVFGEVAFEQELMCGTVSNIDMILGNIKYVDDDNWVILDYEWTFDFPIPANYIVYRMLHYLLNTNPFSDVLSQYDLFKHFHISDKEKDMYEHMEMCFQQYVLGDNIPIRHMHKNLSKAAYDVDYTLVQAKERRKLQCIQVYYDYGQGYIEQNSWNYEPQADLYGVIHLKINIPEGVRNVRIDPASCPCVVAVSDAYANDGELYPVEYTTNGICVDGGIVFWEHNDPQICIYDLKEKTTELELKLEVSTMYGRLAQKVYKCAKNMPGDSCEYAELEKHYHAAMGLKAELERQVADLNHRLYIAESNFHAIQGSFAWRLTKPLRKTLDGIKWLLDTDPRVKILIKSCIVFAKHGIKNAKQYYADTIDTWQKRFVSDKIVRLTDTDEIKALTSDTKFSIIVPLYNTPETFLHEMIESVLTQSYQNWELCMADGSDKEHKYVKRICMQYHKVDSRIKYKKIKKNLGISGNTNVALHMSTGNFITLFDHDDFLHPYALEKTVKAIEEKGADYIYTDEAVFTESMFDNVRYHYKPDFAPDTFRGVNYICHLSSFSAELLAQVGEFRSECDGSQDYDLMLRLTEKAKCIVHIPEVLYYWRSHAGSVASGIGAKMYAIDGAHVALRDHLMRIGLKGEVLDAVDPSSYRIKYEIQGNPLISILIPNKDHVEDLDKCIMSIKNKSTYSNYEIIVIENNSELKETFDYYTKLEKDDKVQVVYYQGGFNYSAINNFGEKSANGDYLILLNNDIEVITPEWMEEMLMYAQREDVGAVGPMLYYEDDTIQHAGLVIGIAGSAGHSHKGFPRGDLGYLYKLSTVQNFSGVTGACLMISKAIYEELNGLDEQFVVAFNDVDFCLRVREAGYLNVFTPFAELYHYESKSRGYEDTPEKQKRFEGERNLLRERWKQIIIEDGDPYYNPNLTLDREDFGLRG